MKLSHLLTAFLVFALAVAGCSSKKKNNNMNEQGNQESMAESSGTSAVTSMNSDFSADLSGENEVPDAVETDASGKAYFKVNSDSTELSYTINLSKADSVIMAHIHYGTSNDNGPISVWLFPSPDNQSKSLEPGPINGTLKSGTVTDSTLTGPFSGKTVLDLVHAIQNDSAYVMIHTSAHPEGELRGQIESPM
ncbi:MAG TPA: CHRD domain-containing protein [Balneolaceae bacterium]|nr:CHRD domain-containing protein [Balneolaceae bacterium]